MNRRWDKWGAGIMIRAGLLSRFESRENAQENVLRILDYHRVGRPDPVGCRSDPSLYNATVEAFAEQMEYLVREYHIISISDLLEAIITGQPLPPRSVMVTFDDGYHDFLENAWPILRRFQIPVTLFVVTGYLSQNARMFWWDKLYQAIHRTDCVEVSVPRLGCWPLRTLRERIRAFAYVKRYVQRQDHHRAMVIVDQVVESLHVPLLENGGMLTWDEVRRMRDEGLFVAAHTVSHPILSRMPLDEARYEITASQQTIVRELGHAWPVFAYPVGHPADLRPELISILREENFRVAMTMIEGHNVVGRTPLLRLKRVGMAPHLTMPEFRLVLTGAYNVYGLASRLVMTDG